MAVTNGKPPVAAANTKPRTPKNESEAGPGSENASQRKCFRTRAMVRSENSLDDKALVHFVISLIDDGAVADDDEPPEECLVSALGNEPRSPREIDDLLPGEPKPDVLELLSPVPHDPVSPRAHARPRKGRSSQGSGATQPQCKLGGSMSSVGRSTASEGTNPLTQAAPRAMPQRPSPRTVAVPLISPRHASPSRRKVVQQKQQQEAYATSPSKPSLAVQTSQHTVGRRATVSMSAQTSRRDDRWRVSVTTGHRKTSDVVRPRTIGRLQKVSPCSTPRGSQVSPCSTPRGSQPSPRTAPQCESRAPREGAQLHTSTEKAVSPKKNVSWAPVIIERPTMTLLPARHTAATPPRPAIIADTAWQDGAQPNGEGGKTGGSGLDLQECLKPASSPKHRVSAPTAALPSPHPLSARSPPRKPPVPRFSPERLSPRTTRKLLVRPPLSPRTLPDTKPRRQQPLPSGAAMSPRSSPTASTINGLGFGYGIVRLSPRSPKSPTSQGAHAHTHARVRAWH